MSIPGFEELSFDEAKAINEEQKSRRASRQKLESRIICSLMISGFSFCFAASIWLLAAPENLATDYSYIPFGGMAV